jgi:hypothetical protein
MVNLKSWRDAQSGTPLTGLAYLAVEELPDGKLRNLRDGELQRLADMGFQPVSSVKSEVTREGSKITYTGGFDFCLIEGVPKALSDMLKPLAPTLIGSIIEPFYEQLERDKPDDSKT